jgi:hypothetical protein
MSYEIKIKNKKVFDFYNANKHLNFEEMCCLMVDVLEKISMSTDTSVNKTLGEKVLTSINSLNTQVQNMDKLFENKFDSFKKEYTAELNTILRNVHDDKIIQVLKDYNESLQDKTKNLFNDIFPKNNEIITNHIRNSFSTFDSIINSSEARINNTINEKLSDIHSIGITQNKIAENVTAIINKFNNSSSKGNFSENSLMDILTFLYPYGNVEHVGNKLSNSGDIHLNRKDKTTIIFENKEYEKTVVQAEVDKFVNNIVLNQCDGIMLSQSSQIIFKDDFEINFNGDSILVYICNVNYDISKIRTAISIIDHLKEKKESIQKQEHSIIISHDDFDIINKEYNILVNQKKCIIKTLTDCFNKNIEEIRQLRVPALEVILQKQFGIKLSDEEICQYCQKLCKNKAGISAHLKSCENYKNSINNINNINKLIN